MGSQTTTPMRPTGRRSDVVTGSDRTATATCIIISAHHHRSRSSRRLRIEAELAARSNESRDTACTADAVAPPAALGVQLLVKAPGPQRYDGHGWRRGFVPGGQGRVTRYRLCLSDDLRREVTGDLEPGEHRIEHMGHPGEVSTFGTLFAPVSHEIGPSHRHESHPSQNLDTWPVRGSPTLDEVLILLPPSESKTARSGGKPSKPELVSFPELASTRTAVAEALARVSGQPDAPALLGVSTNLRADIAHNVCLDCAPAVPVADLYTGVLYDALDLASMDSATRRRANRWLVVISALFGALRLTDKIPPYRLSMSVNLDMLGPLRAVWRTPLASVLPKAAGHGVIVDCRSSTYAAAWVPQGALAARWVQVHVRGATHMTKHTRGLVARHLCEQGVDARTPEALQRIVAQHFETTLTRPRRPGKPWTLDTMAQ